MEASGQYYIHILRDHLTQKQKTNPSYSMRAYARDLGLHCSTLSSILNGKRKLPYKSSRDVAEKMGLKPKERTLFMESLYRSKTKLDAIKINESEERFIMDESCHKVISEWEHFALETLLECDQFQSNIEWISNKLGITKNRAEVVIQNLKIAGLIVEENGEFKKVHAKIRTTEDVLNSAIQQGHKEALDMGKNKLNEVAVELRDFSEVTIAMNLDQVPEVKAIIREFRQKVMALVRDGEKKDVCQLAIQFYPLTKQEKHLEDT